MDVFFPLAVLRASAPSICHPAWTKAQLLAGWNQLFLHIKILLDLLRFRIFLTRYGEAVKSYLNQISLLIPTEGFLFILSDFIPIGHINVLTTNFTEQLIVVKMSPLAPSPIRRLS